MRWEWRECCIVMSFLLRFVCCFFFAGGLPGSGDQHFARDGLRRRPGRPPETIARGGHRFADARAGPPNPQRVDEVCPQLAPQVSRRFLLGP